MHLCPLILDEKKSVIKAFWWLEFRVNRRIRSEYNPRRVKTKNELQDMQALWKRQGKIRLKMLTDFHDAGCVGFKFESNYMLISLKARERPSFLSQSFGKIFQRRALL